MASGKASLRSSYDRLTFQVSSIGPNTSWTAPLSEPISAPLAREEASKAKHSDDHVVDSEPRSTCEQKATDYLSLSC